MSHDCKPRRGSAALEFALCLPVLVTLVTALCDYGWYLGRKLEILDATRDAVRVGVSGASSPIPATTARLATALEWVGVPRGTAVVTATTRVDTTLDATLLTVTVSVPFTPPFGLVPIPRTISTTLTMLVSG